MRLSLLLACLALAVPSGAAYAAALTAGVIYEADYSFNAATDITDGNYLSCLADPLCSALITGDMTPSDVFFDPLIGTPGDSFAYRLYDTSGSVPLSDSASFVLPAISVSGNSGLVGLTGPAASGILRFSLSGDGQVEGLKIVGLLPVTFTYAPGSTFEGIYPGETQTFTALTNIRAVRDPDPDPGVVPLPAAGWLLLGGVAGLGALRRRRKT